MDRSSLGTMTKYRRKRLAAAYKDDRLRPALTYATNVSPTDVGLPDEFGCVICWKVLRNTIVCPNGHRVCKVCFTKLPWSMYVGYRQCPMCRTVAVFQFAPHVDAQLSETQAKCPYVRASTGVSCHWTGRWCDMRDHVHCFEDVPPRAAADDDRPAAQVLPPAAAVQDLCDGHLGRATAEVYPRPADQPAAATANAPQPQSPGGLWDALMWVIFG